jgi:hypothetical protein
MRILGISVAVLLLVSAGCVVKNDKKRPDAVTAAEALTNSVSFEGGKLVEGLMPDPDDDSVSLVPDAVGLVDPGDDALMAFDVQPDDSEVEAALIQFEGTDSYFLIDSDSFVEAAADGGVTGRVELAFKADRDVCDKLCDTIFDVEVTQAVRLRNGDVSKHGRGTLKLDCSGDGNKDLCTGDEDNGGKQPARNDAGSRDPDGGGGDLVPERDGGTGFSLMDVAAGTCAMSGETCNGMDAYLECVMSACDAEYKECFGARYQTGDYSGSVCETFLSCSSDAPDPCNTDCKPDSECQACMNGFTACTQECITTLDCSNIDGGGPIALPDAGVDLPDLTKTCADLEACCATISGTQQEDCQMVVATYKSLGSVGDPACSSVFSTYCP